MSTKERVLKVSSSVMKDIATSVRKVEGWLGKHKAVAMLFAISSFAMPLVLAPLGFAAGNEKEIAKGISRTIITIVCAVFAIINVFNLVVAIGELTSAGADDGPAKSKATNKIAWSIAGIFIPAIIIGLKLEEQIVKFIDIIK